MVVSQRLAPAIFEVAPPHPFELASEGPRVDAATEPAERLCVYCGGGIYAAPRTLTARCPSCQRQNNVRSLDLHGEMLDTQTITAGTIRVHGDARVSGHLIASRVIVEGRVLGAIAASHRCTIRATGKVAGHILARFLTIDAGAEVTAEIEPIS